MKRLLVSAVLGVGLLFFAAQAPAYVVNYDTNDNGIRAALAITDLTIGSLGTYDVVFRDANPSTFTFYNEANARAAAAAINDALSHTLIDYVADPIASSAGQSYAVPYYLSSVSHCYNISSTGSSAGWSAESGFYDYGTNSYLHAVFTPSAPVPIPGALWLLGSGLLGLVVVRRKRRN